MTGFVTRFAPSPTGALHLGHAFAALTALDAARAAGGRFLLRIEDLDGARCRPEFETAIYEDLAWLGVAWETPVRRQSEHMGDYARVLDDLVARSLVYRDFRTRRELMAESVNAPHELGVTVRGGPASDEAERLATGQPFAWRLSLDRCRDTLGADWISLGFEADGVWTKAEPERLGDAILARKEFPASYHLASVHDDALQGITHIIRGEDLRDAAHLHVLLQRLLGLPTPTYRHHRLILGDNGKRLAKRDLAVTLRAMRASGETPSSIRAQLGLRE
ncbi:MAG: tRNA glutamyl-Q(34) synthetase GluQRS [Hyphomonadaceae bacterium]|nr:tRNA glutamyl-Q(34) synthetase GluQRS [Hyphomonadaceae bacterium]